MAPELIKNSGIPSQSSDIFALGIILKEIIYWKPASSFVVANDTDRNAYESRGEYDALVLRGQVIDLISLSRRCSASNSQERGDIRSVSRGFRKITGIQKQIAFIEKLMGRLQRYANDLEDLVAERVIMLRTEMKTTDDLLLQMLPRSVKSDPISQLQCYSKWSERSNTVVCKPTEYWTYSRVSI